ncbi:MAG: hypothetical protein WDA70_03665 [Lysobacteraceae bacterium]
MTQQTLSQSRVINPILTTHAQGYVMPGNVGHALFPRADVGTYGGQILTFGQEGFRRYNTKRAPGAATKRVTFGYEGEKYAIVPSALEALVPDEVANDAQKVPGVDAAGDAVDLVLNVFGLEHECECADLARTAGNYDNDHKVALTGQDRWRGTSGDPTDDIETAKEAIRGSIGIRPNTLLLSASSLSALKANSKIRTYMDDRNIAALTRQVIADMWEIPNVVIGEAVAATGQDDDFGDVWGNDAILAYVAPPSGSNRRNRAQPSYGYTYTIPGHPNVRQPYRDQNRVSWVYPVSCDRTPVLAGVTAGYLIQNAGAAPA